MEQLSSKGKNVKCFDRVKLTHLLTGYRIHSNDFECKAGSYNQAVSVHKSRDETDWFIVVHGTISDISYHFLYNDVVAFHNASAKKYLHLSGDFESAVSKNHEVSLCELGGKEMHELEDEWIVEFVEKTQDQYWRVGELIRLKHKLTSSYLCSHRKKMRENDDFQVYGQNLQRQKQKSKEPSGQPSKDSSDKLDERIWIISQIDPFRHSAPINTRKQGKISEEAEELKKLEKTISSIPRNKGQRKDGMTALLKQQNTRLEQLESERKKKEEQLKKLSWWRRYLCYCCPEKQGYTRLV